MSAGSKTVFLSYASQDAEAACRICETLRSAGVEVWFDQSELRGGDAWDAKIRKQIKECALFLPIISQDTERRHEGYFRREWKLAVERTHDMAASRAFLLPLVIDTTRESEAEVPEEFLRVQWTRLSDRVLPPGFVGQVKRLLESPRTRTTSPVSGVARDEPIRAADLRPLIANSPTKKPRGRWIGLVAGVVVLAVTVAVWLKLQDSTGAVETRLPDVVGEAKLTAAPAKSIAVLPFENLSRDPQNDVFTDGMHDDVITALTKIHDLTVISRSSVLGYKSATRNLRAIAGELNVAHVLEGSVQREGTRIKLNVQLTDAHTSRQLWADHYTEEITDSFAVQEKLAGAITTALQARFSPEERTLIARRITENPEAYELYMRASRLEESASLRTPGRYAEAIALYEQTVVRDPKFALAYAKLSAAHGLFYWFSTWDATPGRREKAKAALDAAERLAPEAPETMVARGVYAYRCETDFARALAHHLAAERELPNDAALQDYIGATLRRLGRLAEAAERFRRSVALNPRSLAVAESYVQSLFYVRRYEALHRFVQEKRAVFAETPGVLDEFDARARYALDGDAKRCAEALAKASDLGALSLGKARQVGDLAAAKAALTRYLAAGRPDDVYDAYKPVALWEAQIAYLEGRRDDGRRFGTQALSELAVMTPSARADQSNAVFTALALAYAGRDSAESADRAYAAIVSSDKLRAANVAMMVAETFLVAGKRDRALDYLELSFANGATQSAAELGHDLLWASLRTEPRFAAILKSLTPR